jgi:hypothetical protein
MFPLYFQSLKRKLPANIDYHTKITFDPSRPGGTYNQKSDTLIFGTSEVNISQIIGFTHEFGHSVFYALGAPNEDNLNECIRPVYLGLNEAYAELWGHQLCSLKLEPINCASGEGDLKGFLEYRNLITLRFHLMIAHLERNLRSHAEMTSEEYIKMAQDMGRTYLSVESFPPLIPVLPQSLTPGYLQSYALMFIATPAFEKEMSDDRVESLINIGKEIVGDGSESHFVNLYQKLIFAFKKKMGLP